MIECKAGFLLGGFVIRTLSSRAKCAVKWNLQRVIWFKLFPVSGPSDESLLEALQESIARASPPCSKAIHPKLDLDKIIVKR